MLTSSRPKDTSRVLSALLLIVIWLIIDFVGKRAFLSDSDFRWILVGRVVK